MEKDIAAIRREYTRNYLNKNETPSDPFELFRLWLDQAINSEEKEPTAMLVATATPDGRPSTRTVLLKEVSTDNKFIFYTNYESRKGKQIESNPYVSLSFVWHQLERQVHIEGRAEKVSPEQSDAYFRSRPYKSKVGARVSPQSRPIGSRMEIMQAFMKESLKYTGREIERPDWWGGYAVTPVRMEFWQGRSNRLHDRILYTLQKDGKWEKERIAP